MVLLLAAGYGAWNQWMAPTRIAFVNYQATTLGQLAKSNTHDRIRLATLSVDELDQAGQYDVVLVNGMGLRITAEQRTQLEQAAARGLTVLTTMATNPANDLTTADSLTAATMQAYLRGAGRRNYRNLLTYIRRTVDGKTWDTEQPEAPVQRAWLPFFHADPKHPEAEERDFGSVAAYEQFLSQQGLTQSAGASRILVTGQMGDPLPLMTALEKAGHQVYGVRDLETCIRRQQADSIRPSAVINLAHGRLGDAVVKYLKQQNILLFSPLNVNRRVEDWEADKQGMNGGFLSQSVVMPEIDGALRPYALFGHEVDAEGLEQVVAMPERLATFVESVNRHLALRQQPNADKRVAIYYYKGPGQHALTAAGLEVGPSLYQLLLRLKQEGYRVHPMPASAAELEAWIQQQGTVYNAYAKGAKQEFLEKGKPALVSAADYAAWTAQAVSPSLMQEVEALDGPFPGSYLHTESGELALPRVDLGNVVLLPQLAAGAGEDDFAIVHGTDAAPPHAYIASYLWARFGFQADVLLHFGTHGSLEFTPRKQVALGPNDWPDVLVGPMPHLYLYSIGDVGEGMIAKRRSYATLQSHLTPPFMESKVRGIYRELTQALEAYNDRLYADGQPDTRAAALQVKCLTVQLGIHRELRLDSVLTQPYTEAENARIESFAEELANEKVTGTLYTLGVPYASERIRSSVLAMATDPIAYSLLALDQRRGKAAPNLEKQAARFTREYVNPARSLVEQLLDRGTEVTDAMLGEIGHLTQAELDSARTIDRALSAPQDLMSRMRALQAQADASGNASVNGAASHPAGVARPSGGGHPSWIPKIGHRPEASKKASAVDTSTSATPSSAKSAASASAASASAASASATKPAASAAPFAGMPASVKAKLGLVEYSKEQQEFARVVMELDRTLRNVTRYREALETSPETELASLMNALNGGYTAPSPGGDPIANPNTLPTGRNLYAVNAEATPSERAWERGKELAENTIRMYRERHHDSIPRKVSYTLWSGEFVETEGATLAQAFYMLGVEPLRDVFGRVTDLRLIPSETLGRPRIDVVVQTSGQLRDLAASRLFLLSRAVEMAAAAKDDRYDNYVARSVVEAERVLVDKGLSPKEAREVATYRVFGGVNGNYGTGITGMVQSGDRWEDPSEVAAVYLQNMGAYYGSEKAWEQVRQYALEAALTHTDAVVQPRQSNTWGALSLDHVYEFMGGMNLAVRQVTGKEPDAYLSDYRNRNRMRIQEVKEAIGIESRTTIFNPAYLREKMKGGASAAAGFAEIIQNTYGWNVMKPDAIDDALWNEIYAVYVQDKFDLGIRRFFEQQNPAALQEMTAVMLETARKGLWQASDEQLKGLAQLHTELVEQFRPACSGMVCDNAKLRSFIARQSTPEVAQRYEQTVREVREAAVQGSHASSVVLKQENRQASPSVKTWVDNSWVALLVLGAVGVWIWVVHRRRQKMER